MCVYCNHGPVCWGSKIKTLLFLSFSDAITFKKKTKNPTWLKNHHRCPSHMGLFIMMWVQILERKNVNLASLGSLIQLQKHRTTEPPFKENHWDTTWEKRTSFQIIYTKLQFINPISSTSTRECNQSTQERGSFTQNSCSTWRKRGMSDFSTKKSNYWTVYPLLQKKFHNLLHGYRHLKVRYETTI